MGGLGKPVCIIFSDRWESVIFFFFCFPRVAMPVYVPPINKNLHIIKKETNKQNVWTWKDENYLFVGYKKKLIQYVNKDWKPQLCSCLWLQHTHTLTQTCFCCLTSFHDVLMCFHWCRSLFSATGGMPAGVDELFTTHSFVFFFIVTLQLICWHNEGLGKTGMKL